MIRKLQIYITLVLLLALFSLTISWYSLKVEKDHFCEIAESLLGESNFIKYFSNPKITFDNAAINIKLDSNDQFDELPIQERFSSLEYYNKQIRYLLQSSIKENRFYKNKYTIVINSKENSYVFKSKIPNQIIPFKVMSTLSINGEDVYNSEKLANAQIPISDEDQINGYTYEEIFNYAVRIYNLLTDNGTKYYPKIDAPIILDTVVDKFGITNEDYETIYRRMYFQLDTYQY